MLKETRRSERGTESHERGEAVTGSAHVPFVPALHMGGERPFSGESGRGGSSLSSGSCSSVAHLLEGVACVGCVGPSTSDRDAVDPPDFTEGDGSQRARLPSGEGVPTPSRRRRRSLASSTRSSADSFVGGFTGAAASTSETMEDAAMAEGAPACFVGMDRGGTRAASTAKRGKCAGQGGRNHM